MSPYLCWALLGFNPPGIPSKFTLHLGSSGITLLEYFHTKQINEGNYKQFHRTFIGFFWEFFPSQNTFKTTCINLQIDKYLHWKNDASEQQSALPGLLSLHFPKYFTFPSKTTWQPASPYLRQALLGFNPPGIPSKFTHHRVLLDYVLLEYFHIKHGFFWTMSSHINEENYKQFHHIFIGLFWD